MRHQFVSIVLVLAGALMFSAVLEAQTKTFDPRDFQGVWIGKRGGGTAVDTKLKPPMTPWAQARWDAAVPTVGPRVIAGSGQTLIC